MPPRLHHDREQFCTRNVDETAPDLGTGGRRERKCQDGAVSAVRSEPASGAMNTDEAAILRRLLDVALAAAAERRPERVLRLILNAARELLGAPDAAVGGPGGS